MTSSGGGVPAGRVEPPSGTGPGVITPDGCAVELYALLPPGGEPEIVDGAVPEGASILELGAGTGRMTHPLLELRADDERDQHWVVLQDPEGNEFCLY